MLPARLSLILVDDNPDFIFFLKYALQEQGVVFDSVHLKEGGQLLDLLSLEKVHFDGILIDMNMPHQTGLETLTELRQKALRPEIPVIAMSAVIQPAYTLALKQIGVANYLQKPFDLDEFKTFVQNMLVHFRPQSPDNFRIPRSDLHRQR